MSYKTANRLKQHVSVHLVPNKDFQILFIGHHIISDKLYYDIYFDKLPYAYLSFVHINCPVTIT